MSNKSEAKTILPLIVAVIVIVGGLATYAFQKYVDRNYAITSMRSDFYTEFLDTFLMSRTGRSTPEIEARYSRLRLRLLLISSDEVIKSFNDVREFLGTTEDGLMSEEEIEKFNIKFAALILAIRKDSFEKSQYSVDDFSKFMPFKGRDS